MKGIAYYCTECSLFISKVHCRNISEIGFKVTTGEASLEKLIVQPYTIGVMPQRGAMDMAIRFDPSSTHIDKLPDVGPLVQYGQLWNRASRASLYGLAVARRKAHEAAYTGEVRANVSIDMGLYRGNAQANAFPSDVASYETRALIGADGPTEFTELAQKFELSDQRKQLADKCITEVIKIVPNVAASLQIMEETSLRVSAGQIVDLNPPTMAEKIATHSGKLKMVNGGLAAGVGAAANMANTAQRNADIMEGNWDKQLNMLLRIELVIDPNSYRATSTLPECVEKTFTPAPNGSKGCLYVDCYGAKGLGKDPSIDTYLKIQTSDCKDKYDYYATDYSFNNVEPSWNQRLIIPTSTVPAFLTIRVKLEGKSYGANKVIGHYKLDTSSVTEGNPLAPKWYSLEQPLPDSDSQLMLGVSFDSGRVGPAPAGRTKMKNFKERSAAKAKATIEDTFQMSFREATKWLVFTARVGVKELQKKNWTGRADVSATGMKKYLSTSVSTSDPTNDKLLASLEKNSNAQRIVSFAQNCLEGLKQTAAEMYRAQLHTGVAGIGFVLPLGPIVLTLNLYAETSSIPSAELEEALKI
eukprot:TRINITY_DN408_c0_g2_i1.p1 TRINITY_DN408_c0_g2~~TRINITY_DN408_c0_g2_i1.p1  ORF type:complete len:687 (+),score=147.02 TRINITY_DN408_c0_g2_i1:310-2061(+)